MLKAVIFDMDGVIIDSEPAHLRVCLELFKKLNIDLSEEEYGRFIGVSNTSMWTTLKQMYGLAQTIQELAEQQARANIDDFKNGDDKPMPGILELLSNLKKEGIKIGLASSSPLETINLILEKFEIKDYFDAVVSGEGLKGGKPAPDIYHLSVSRIGKSPEACLAIEDSFAGIQSAKAAGLYCAGLRTIHVKEELLDNADLKISSLAEISDWINKLK
jgi:HAD superfamily hydrolase (TIGR01509 family)